MPADVRITLLADLPEALPMLAGLFVAEWEPYYGPEGLGDAEADLRACCNRDRIPLAVVAIDAAGTVAGTAALKPESVASHRHLGPWLAALVVAPAHRGRNIGATLVAAVEDEARRLGFPALYTGESPASGLARLLVRRGWHEVEGEASSLRGPMTIYRLSLTET